MATAYRNGPMLLRLLYLCRCGVQLAILDFRPKFWGSRRPGQSYTMLRTDSSVRHQPLADPQHRDQSLVIGQPGAKATCYARSFCHLCTIFSCPGWRLKSIGSPAVEDIHMS